MRRSILCVLALAAVVTRPVSPGAQTSAPPERVWTGVWQEHYFAERRSGTTRSQTTVTYTFTEQVDPDGSIGWKSRAVQWSYREESEDFDRVALRETAPDDRGFTLNRYRTDIRRTCTASGSAELGATPVSERVITLPAGQASGLRPTCVTEATARDTGETTRATTPGDLVGLPGLPSETEMPGCRYAKTWRRETPDGFYEGSHAVTASRPVTAIMEVSRRVDDAYVRFVPSPGGTLMFTASVPTGAGRFRFELDPDATSRFPGYATNANVDSAFFSTFEATLGHLRERYADDSPDVIFDAARFDRREWSRLDSLVVETARPQRAATVTVTTMDYGAVGRLRAFIRAEDCGDWQPIPVRFHPDMREFVSIPLDEDDNLIADSLEDYAGLASGVDADGQPKGNGTAGDGLTAFEEYRGVITSGGDCANPAADMHVRTTPQVKDLFVHTPDPELEAVFEHTAWASGLNVHAICERHYSGNPEFSWTRSDLNGDLGTRPTSRKRIVNMTLQLAGVRDWNGHAVSQPIAQHGLYLVNRDLEGVGGCSFGESVPSCSDTLTGPPMVTSVVAVDKISNGEPLSLISTVTHELGHSVGLPHHGQRVVSWHIETVNRNIKRETGFLMVVAPGGDCVEPAEGVAGDIYGLFRKGKFVGCLTRGIVIRHAENSGNADCPMRYSFGGYFREAPDSPRITGAFAYGDVEQGSTGERRAFGYDRRVYLYSGRFLQYDYAVDFDAIGQFCLTNKATKHNAPAPDYAGDSQVACMDQLVANDNVMRGVQ